MTSALVHVERVGKRFCRNFRRSLWYGLGDLGSELIGRPRDRSRLRRDEFWALSDVSLRVERGATVGLIGRNGAGKTTLLRMLNGLIRPDTGRIEVRGRIQALIALGAGFNPVLTGRENVYVNGSILGMRRSEIDRLFDAIVDFAGIAEFIDAPVQSYSSGMAVRLGFAVAVHLEPDVLLVDEVLAVGDEGFQTRCLSRIAELKGQGTGIVLVSHNMHAIESFADEVILLDGGRHERFEDVSAGIRAYRALFLDESDTRIEQLTTGSPELRILDVDIPRRALRPGESFEVTLHYDASVDFEDPEIDLAILGGGAPLYFQATNRAYGRPITLRRGVHQLGIEIRDVRIAESLGRVVVALWSKGRAQQLFWWRIPVRFEAVAHSTGQNFLAVEFRHDGHAIPAGRGSDPP
jgi:lipopolysaccharide transport system ATP-binding protein